MKQCNNIQKEMLSQYFHSEVKKTRQGKSEVNWASFKMQMFFSQHQLNSHLCLRLQWGHKKGQAERNKILQ